MTTPTRPRTPQPTSARAVRLADISLRKNERGLIAGGTDAGKSTLAERLLSDFIHRYHAAGARALILDTKPRFRAEFEVTGLPAAKRYRRWDHGAAVPGSVIIDEASQLASAWRTGARVVIAQCESKRDIGRVIEIARKFLDDSRAGRPQLLYADEVLDFFHANGMSKGGDDTIERSARAGRERGTAGLYCTQRTAGLSSALLSQLTKLYAFRLDAKKDSKRFQEMGAPDFVVPDDPHVFMYWTKHDYGRAYGPYKLGVKK